MGTWLENLNRDVRYGIRLLRKSPGFTAVAVLTLGVGIGLNTTVFTIYDSVALRLLPVKDAASVVRLTRWFERGLRTSDFTVREFDYVRAHAASFETVAAAANPQRVPAQERLGSETELLQVQLVSGNYFPMLGVPAKLGRVFAADEDGSAGAHPVAVVSHRFWQRRFGNDRAVPGRTYLLNGVAFTLVGITPDWFAGTGAPPTVPDLWVPLAMQEQIAPHQDVGVQLIARRKAGVGDAMMNDELGRIRVALNTMNASPEKDMRALTAKQATFFDTEGGGFETFVMVVQVLMFAVGAVLLIGCVNLVNLVLSRALARQHEIAVRIGLGAGRWQIVQQLATESVILGLLGGAAGLVLSVAACSALAAVLETKLASFGVGAEYLFVDLHPSGHVLAYAILLSALAGILTAVTPAWRVLRGDIGNTIKEETAATFGGRGWFRNALIGMQVAFCMVLLVEAGLLWQGVRASGGVDPGFETKRVVALVLPQASLGTTDAEQAATRKRVLERLRDIPQLSAVALALNPPLLGHMQTYIETPGSKTAVTGEEQRTLYNEVSSEYFETLGIPVLRGRAFTALEAERHEAVVMVSEAAARRYWPGEDAVGQRIVTPKRMFDTKLANRSFTVVGVVKSVRSTNLSKVDPSYLYFPAAADHTGLILVRTNVPDRAAIPLLRDALLEVNRAAALEMMAISVENGPVLIQRLMTEAPATVAASLAALALLLATVGIYGVVSFLVSRRTREIGLRVALGASQGDVGRLVLAEALKPVCWGIVFGLGASAGVSVLLRKLVAAPDMPDLLFGVSAWNPATFLCVPLFLLSVVVAATVGPMRRAMRVDPAVALRNE